MAIIKKTVALESIFDEYIRSTWAMLIKRGYDASYSTALNYMLVEHILSVSEDGVSKKTREAMQSFLEDKETIEDLNLEDYANMVDNLFKEKNRRKK